MKRILLAAIAALALISSVQASCVKAFSYYSVACVSTNIVPCSIDGRLKGVRVGTDLFRRTMRSFPNHQCDAGSFIAKENDHL
jgi:hypothetical protein